MEATHERCERQVTPRAHMRTIDCLRPSFHLARFHWSLSSRRWTEYCKSTFRKSSGAVLAPHFTWKIDCLFSKMDGIHTARSLQSLRRSPRAALLAGGKALASRRAPPLCTTPACSPRVPSAPSRTPSQNPRIVDFWRGTHQETSTFCIYYSISS